MGGALVTLTDFGDSSVLLAMTVLGAVYLGLNGRKQAALVVLGGFLFASIVIALAKVVLIGCGSSEPLWNIRSPSGHTALSVVTFGLLAHILGSGLRPPIPRLASLAALAFAAMIGMSRVALGAHSWQEVIAGGLIGLLLLAALLGALGTQPMLPSRPWKMMTLCLAVALSLHGIHLPAEDMIRRVAGLLRASGQVCLAQGELVFSVRILL